LTARKLGRRQFISLLGGVVAALPRRAAAQPAELPVVGFLHAATVESYVSNATAFARGLLETGFAEAQNFAVEYRFANGQIDQLGMLAADLAGRSVALIVAGGAAAAVAAKAATSTIPIVVVSGSDPARLGLVASLSRPGGNLTGATFATTGQMSKKVGLLRALVPRMTAIGYLAEDARAYGSGSPILPALSGLRSEILAAASDLDVVVAEIGSDRERDYEMAFATFAEHRVAALIVAPSAIFASDADEIVSLTLRDQIPAVFPRRADAVAGGLIGYGASQADAWQQAGIRAGRILGGAAPGDMPVAQSTRLELVINMPIAKTLSLVMPPELVAQADELVQ
jgi:putative ABC transport system substrate-binding protein